MFHFISKMSSLSPIGFLLVSITLILFFVIKIIIKLMKSKSNNENSNVIGETNLNPKIDV